MAMIAGFFRSLIVLNYKPNTAANKNFKLKAEQIVKLIEPMRGCIATDKITVEGELVDYMVRKEPDNDVDTGW
jgi:hypothetical protein